MMLMVLPALSLSLIHILGVDLGNDDGVVVIVQPDLSQNALLAELVVIILLRDLSGSGSSFLAVDVRCV